MADKFFPVFYDWWVNFYRYENATPDEICKIIDSAIRYTIDGEGRPEMEKGLFRAAVNDLINEQKRFKSCQTAERKREWDRENRGKKSESSEISDISDKSDISDNFRRNPTNPTHTKTKTKTKTKTETTTAPTREEVAAEADRIGKWIDPDEFLTYYSALGWKDASGNPIRNWKAYVVFWCAKHTKPDEESSITQELIEAKKRDTSWMKSLGYEDFTEDSGKWEDDYNG